MSIRYFHANFGVISVHPLWSFRTGCLSIRVWCGSNLPLLYLILCQASFIDVPSNFWILFQGSHVMANAGTYILQWKFYINHQHESFTSHKAQIMYFYERLKSADYRCVLVLFINFFLPNPISSKLWKLNGAFVIEKTRKHSVKLILMASLRASPLIILRLGGAVESWVLKLQPWSFLMQPFAV